MIDAGKEVSIAWQFLAYALITAAEVMVSPVTAGSSPSSTDRRSVGAMNARNALEDDPAWSG